MKTRYVISYRGSEAYVCSYDRNTGEGIYTPQIENAYKFDSLIEARLEIFNLVRPEEYYIVAVWNSAYCHQTVIVAITWPFGLTVKVGDSRHELDAIFGKPVIDLFFDICAFPQRQVLHQGFKHLPAAPVRFDFD